MGACARQNCHAQAFVHAVQSKVLAQQQRREAESENDKNSVCYGSQLHDIARRERRAYESERAELLDERGKLLQAHYAGAIPIDLLKTEQERISRRLAFMDVQIEAGDMEYDQAKAHLNDCLALAGNCYKLLTSVDDSLRRTANQAFFEKLYAQDDNRIEGQIGEPFNIFFDPDIQKLKLHPSLV